MSILLESAEVVASQHQPVLQSDDIAALDVKSIVVALGASQLTRVAVQGLGS
jgi:hypothetical protein